MILARAVQVVVPGPLICPMPYMTSRTHANSTYCLTTTSSSTRWAKICPLSVFSQTYYCSRTACNTAGTNRLNSEITAIAQIHDVACEGRQTIPSALRHPYSREPACRRVNTCKLFRWYAEFSMYRCIKSNMYFMRSLASPPWFYAGAVLIEIFDVSNVKYMSGVHIYLTSFFFIAFAYLDFVRHQTLLYAWIRSTAALSEQSGTGRLSTRTWEFTTDSQASSDRFTYTSNNSNICTSA